MILLSLNIRSLVLVRHQKKGTELYHLYLDNKKNGEKGIKNSIKTGLLKLFYN